MIPLSLSFSLSLFFSLFTFFFLLLLSECFSTSCCSGVSFEWMADVLSISLSSISLHTSHLNKRRCPLLLVARVIKNALYVIGFGTQISVKQSLSRQIIYQSVLLNLYVVFFCCFFFAMILTSAPLMHLFVVAVADQIWNYKVLLLKPD